MGAEIVGCSCGGSVCWGRGAVEAGGKGAARGTGREKEGE